MLNGSAVVSSDRRWDGTTWITSPALMYSFALRTIPMNSEGVTFDLTRSWRPMPSLWEGMDSRRWAVEAVDHLLDALGGLAVVGLKVAVERQAGDGLDGAPRVVEDQQRLDEHQAGERQVVRVVGGGREPLEAAGDLVGQEADGAADEARQPGQLRHGVAAEQAIDQDQW